MLKVCFALVVLLIGNLKVVALAAPGEMNREEAIARSQWIVVAKPVKPFQAVHKNCSYPSEWSFEVREVLYQDGKVPALRKGEKVVVSDASYDALVADCERRKKEEGRGLIGPAHYRPLDTHLKLENDLPTDTQLVLFLVRIPERTFFKERTEFVATNAFEHVREKKVIVEQVRKLKKWVPY
jgi:hypothetical protein